MASGNFPSNGRAEDLHESTAVQDNIVVVDAASVGTEEDLTTEDPALGALGEEADPVGRIAAGVAHGSDPGSMEIVHAARGLRRAIGIAPTRSDTARRSKPDQVDI